MMGVRETGGEMPLESSCRIDAILKIIGDRWTLGIIHELSAGPRRTLDLHNSFKGLSTKTLTERLRRLERNGLIARITYRESPPRVEYSLTQKGTRILPVINSLSQAYRDLYEERNGAGAAGCKLCSALTEDRSAPGDLERRDAEDDSYGEVYQAGEEQDGIRRASRNRKRQDITLL
jgi:DNA-binding HxlR family transcriptional regulator